MKVTARLHPIPAAGEEFYLEVSGLQEAAEECLSQIRERLTEKISSALLNGKSLRELEESIHQEVSRCLDQFVARLVQAAHFDPRVVARASKLAELRPCMRLQNRSQQIALTFLGGSQVVLTSPYMLSRPKKKRGRPRKNKGRGKNGSGLYPILEVLGIRERATPAVASEVARQMALGTVTQTQQNLATRGIHLGRKKIHTLALRVGERGLRFRAEVMEPSPSGRDSLVEGHTLLIGTDGGRLRTRIPKRGRKKKSGHRGFKGSWKEPKAIVVSSIDERGRKMKGGYQRYDATLGDCNRAFELIAGHLRMIGAEKARRWVVVGDGAGWIWDRVTQLCEAVGFSMEKVTQIVDFYHAKQRLYLFADKVKSWGQGERKAWIKKASKLLKAGKVEELHQLCSKHFRGCNSKERRSLAKYFLTHKERMRYKSFREANLPIGSGAVESCVRRLVNLRLKGNGIFWTLENAERVLQLRAQLLSDRWNEFIDEIFEPVEFWNLGEEAQAA